MKKNVLIVDDDPGICKGLEEQIRRNFLSTYIAYTGKDALEILSKKRIDIVLLDVHMPDIDGLELLKKIKDKRENCEAIVITGYGSQQIAIESLQRGAIDYLEKPIKLDELDAALGRALERLNEKEDLIYRNSILVVDDDKKYTQKIKKILKKEGYDVFTAYDGIKGLEIINRNKIDVVLTDVKMPVMGGITLLEKAKNIYRDIEVIMITGHGDEELAIKSLRSGAINYLRKPIDLEELCIAIEKAIERIVLYRNRLYRNRELKINKEIISKMNEELERRIKERTQKLSQTQTQLFQTSKLATLGEMSTGLAHELNQPLTGISFAATSIKKLIERGLLTEKKIKESMEDIDTNVQRMSRIINHIRSFARQDTFKSVEMRVNEPIDGALKLLGEQLRLHNIKIIKELDPNLPMIKGEPFQIEQVIINIISNARDALDEENRWEKNKLKDWSKKIIIEAKLIKNHKNEECVCICISDNGIGMSDEVKQKMFVPFYTTKEVGKATGLGMSISYGIIQSHKGRIDVESKKGEGTKVFIEFPVPTKAE